jgi:hypothetical protein
VRGSRPAASAVAAPAAPQVASTGPSLGALVVGTLLVGGLVMWVKGKVDASNQEDEARELADHLERMECELSAEREDIALSRGLPPAGYGGVGWR